MANRKSIETRVFARCGLKPRRRLSTPSELTRVQPLDWFERSVSVGHRCRVRWSFVLVCSWTRLAHACSMAITKLEDVSTCKEVGECKEKRRGEERRGNGVKRGCARRGKKM